MKIFERCRTWWQRRTGEEETPLDSDAPAWVASLLVHVGLLTLLAAVSLSLPSEEPQLTLMVNEPEQVEQSQELQEIHYSDDYHEQVGANAAEGSEGAEALAAVEANISQVNAPEIQADVGDFVPRSLDEVSRAMEVDPKILLRGTGGIGITGAAGAVDRITHEIVLSLEQRRTLVVWIFDKSGSLLRQREAIRERLDRIYHELGVIEAVGGESFVKHKDKPLLTAVMAFGQDVQLMTPEPTDRVDEIKTAISAIETDDSGIERVFTAVHEAARKYRPFRVNQPQRNVMLVVFTDEAGDDQSGLDETARLCRKYQMPVYVVGVPAPFGRETVEIKYVDPDPQFDQRQQFIPIHQGPESLLPERIKLHFSGSGGRDEPIDSGFGPYSLTRLSLETGGIYFAVHPNRDARRRVGRGQTAVLSAHLAYFFDPVAMRRYRPDYVSQAEYQKLLNANRARAALVQAANLSWASSLESPRLRFPKRNDAALARSLSQAQQQAAKLEPKVGAIHATLALGEPHRAKLTQPRWQAAYDLAMGRTLAVMVRAKTYNAILAKAKQGMKFSDPKSDTWVLQPSQKVTVGTVLEKQAAAAREYLERAVEEHQGTPWAMLAARELEEPLGWEWAETFTGVNEPPPPRPGGGSPNRPDDRPRVLTKPKPRRTPKL